MNIACFVGLKLSKNTSLGGRKIRLKSEVAGYSVLGCKFPDGYVSNLYIKSYEIAMKLRHGKRFVYLKSRYTKIKYVFNKEKTNIYRILLHFQDSCNKPFIITYSFIDWTTIFWKLKHPCCLTAWGWAKLTLLHSKTHCLVDFSWEQTENIPKPNKKYH